MWKLKEILAESESKFGFYIDSANPVQLEESIKNLEIYKLSAYLDAANGCSPFSPY